MQFFPMPINFQADRRLMYPKLLPPQGFEAGMFQKLFVPIRLFLESKQEGVTVPRVAYATRTSTIRDVLTVRRHIQKWSRCNF